MKFTEETNKNFEHYAKTDPKFLCKWVKFGNIPPGRLTNALEYLGRAEPLPEVKYALRFFLDHPNPFVREGAIEGLNINGLEEQDIEKINDMWLNDSSPGIQNLCREILDEIWEGDFEYPFLELTCKDVEDLMMEVVNGNQGDGEHHKNYHFDQLARKLLGRDYHKWRLRFEYGDSDNGEKIYTWDEGIL